MRKIKINFNTKDLDEKINFAKNTFCKEYADFEFDLSSLNLIDASKTVLLLSAELIKRNSKSKMECFVKDKETLKIISQRKLKNTFLSVNLNENNVKNINFRRMRNFKKTGSI